MAKDVSQGHKILLRYSIQLEQIMDELDSGLHMQDTSSKVMIFLANDLLDFAQMRNGKFRKNVELLNLEKVIQDVVMIQQNQADSKGVSVEIQMEQFYVSSDDYNIYSDEQRIMQVVLNLLSNALKFTDEGGLITITSRLLKEQDKNFVQISVQDTGVGISKDNQKKLFKLFGFLESTKERNSHGVGLGLSIS